MTGTESHEYAERLHRLQSVWWKRVLPVQLPYKLHLRHLDLGLVLEIGSGVGRNLGNLGGRVVGVDHNPEMVAIARDRGFVSLLPNEFRTSSYAQSGHFDSLLVSHVVEHMTFGEAQELVQDYLPYIKSGGTIVIEAPEEAGYRSDETHVTFFDSADIQRLAKRCGLAIEKTYSYPFPRPIGRFFKYNEFVLVGRNP